MTASEINRVFERLGLPDRVKAGEPMTPRHFFAMARAISEKLDAMKGVECYTINMRFPPGYPIDFPNNRLDAMKTAPRDNPGEMG